MTLNCGNNTSLDSLNSIRDTIKGKLAEGKSALGDLQSQATSGLSALNGLKVEIPSDLRSLQTDLNSLLSNVQGDFASAVAQFKQNWGDVLPTDEINGYVNQIQNAGTDFDICSAIPNKELTGGTVKAKAPAAVTPNTNMTKPAEFTPTVTDARVGKITSTMTAWTDERIELSKQRDKYFKKIRDGFLAEQKTMRSEPHYDAIKAKVKETGKKSSQLVEEGSLSEAEIQFRQKYNAKGDEIRFIETREAAIVYVIIAYEAVLVSELEESEFAKIENAYFEKFADDKTEYERNKTAYTNNKASVIEWNNYLKTLK